MSTLEVVITPVLQLFSTIRAIWLYICVISYIVTSARSYWDQACFLVGWVSRLFVLYYTCYDFLKSKTQIFMDVQHLCQISFQRKGQSSVSDCILKVFICNSSAIFKISHQIWQSNRCNFCQKYDFQQISRWWPGGGLTLLSAF